MKIINIDKERNEAIINYNGKEILSATIERFFFVKNKLHIKVKLPDWCCNGQYGLFDISDKFELLKKGAVMKETKVYVDELPKSCSKCEWCTLNHKDNYGRSFCLISRMPLYNGDKIKEERGQHKGSLSDFDCPLKSLHDYKKELVAKVLESVKNEASKDGFYDEDGNKIITYHINNYILDQIQKEFEDGE